jgi:hypothetical protein
MRKEGGKRAALVLGAAAAAVAIAAVLAFGRTWRRTETLLGLLGSEDEGEALAAAEELGARREPGTIPRLLEVFRAHESRPVFPYRLPERFQAMARAILRRGIPPPPALLEALDADEVPVVVFAAWILGAMGEAADPAIPHLARALGSDRVEVAAAAAEALASIATPRTAPPLLAALGDRRRDVSGQARKGLAALPAPSDDSIPLLARLVVTGVPDDRIIAAGLLEKAGQKAASATGALSKAARAEEADVRLASAKALAAIGPAAKGDLENAARSEDPAVSEVAREALARIPGK